MKTIKSSSGGCGSHPTPPDTRKADAHTPVSALKSTLLEVAAELEELKRAVGGSLTDALADWVAAEYLLAARQAVAAEPDPAKRLNILRQAATDVAALQRDGRWTARLKLDRQKLEFEQQKHRDALAAAKPKPHKPVDYSRPLTEKETKAIVDKVDEIMGIK